MVKLAYCTWASDYPAGTGARQPSDRGCVMDCARFRSVRTCVSTMRSISAGSMLSAPLRRGMSTVSWSALEPDAGVKLPAVWPPLDRSDPTRREPWADRARWDQLDNLPAE